MDLKQLEYFVRVVECRNFSKAALKLGIAQPALSRQVRALEVELRQTLLHRHGRGVTVSDAGERLYAHALSILDQVSRAQRDLSDERDSLSGAVSVAMPPTIAAQLTLPLIAHFKAQMPHARLAIQEGLSAFLTEWLREGRVDLALAYNPEPSSVLNVQALRRERLCLVSPATEAPSVGVRLSTLADYPLIMPQRGHSLRRLLESASGLAGIHLNVPWEVSSVPAIVALVGRGYGHAVLPEGAPSTFGQGLALRVTPFEDVVIESALCLVTPSHARSTPLIRKTVETLRQLVLEELNSGSA